MRSVEFPLAATAITVELLEIGAPVVTVRFVPATLSRQELEVSPHGFTLRLGTAARRAFGKASLGSRGGPPDITGFVNAVAALSTRMDGGMSLSGCAALDVLVCGEIGEPRGCLTSLCAQGLATLARRLAAGFEALDGDDLDLFWSGSAPVIDIDGDRKADALGRLMSGGDSPGLWSGEVRARGGVSAFTGIWTAERLSP